MNYLACGIVPQELTYQQKKKLRHEARFFIWDDPLLFRRGVNQIIRKCILESEQVEILDKCHSIWTNDIEYRSFCKTMTGHKILQSSFYWPTLFKDSFEWVKQCDKCQILDNINIRNKIPLQGILVV